ncbi:hypothetical protein Golomagni_06419 [Golovinomyces magnicellulatus]|nr:hypothetical protein Golomagni_06419 [Golovinomyces magnicellulatus]
MKFSVAAVIAAAAGAAANSNVTVTTEVVDVYTTYCPGPTQITHGSKTYTVTEATTLTITDCPCTITKPVITTSAVVCHNCPGNNGTVVPPVQTSAPPAVTAGAAKVAGAGLAGVVGLAALVL